jgi:pyrroloquinoline quinone (PQQ) biosynthesis protein C
MSSTPSASTELQPYLDMLERLKTEAFHKETEERLNHHPYLVAAKEGRLTMAQRRAFCVEQFSVQHSDACSFSRLAGHTYADFHPTSLAQTSLPEAKNVTSAETIPDLFQFLLGGELYASKLLLDHAKSLGLTTEDAIVQAHTVTSRGQAYPSYWARLALNQQHGAAAAACAVNFPAWGSICQQLLHALQTRTEYGYSDSGKAVDSRKADLAFIDFFATPIATLDEMAATIMKREQISYEDLVTPVRLLQEYEILFWDAVFDVKE